MTRVVIDPIYERQAGRPVYVAALIRTATPKDPPERVFTVADRLPIRVPMEKL